MSDRLQRPHSRFLPTQLRSVRLAFCGLVLCTSILAAAGAVSAQTPDATLQTPDGALGNHLGMGLAADAQRIIAGAPGTPGTGYEAKSPALNSVDVTEEGVGAFAIYRDDVSEWTLEQYTLAPFGGDPTFVTEQGLQANIRFGGAVAIDGSRAIVSAPGARLVRYQDPAFPITQVYRLFGRMGIVYAYEYNAGTGTWDVAQMITNAEVSYQNNMKKTRYFGHALSLASDWLAVSSPGNILENNGGNKPRNFPVSLFEYVSTPGPGTPACSSISYAYSLPAPLVPFPTYPCWVEVGAIDPPAQKIAFGAAIAFDPDADVLAVGAPFENSKTGAVHVYRRDGTGAFAFEATLVPSDSAEYDLFGVSVVAELDRLAVGAQLKPCVVESVGVFGTEICTADVDGLLATGAVYIFDYDAGSGSWSEVEKVLPPTDATYQFFGTSLALEGDDLLVGTPGTVLDEAYQGSVHRYRDNGSAFEWIEDIKGPTAIFDAVFGARVTVRGNDVIASSPNQDYLEGVEPPSGYYTGEVFVYSNYLASSSSGGGAAPVTGPEPGMLSGWAALAVLGALASRRRRAEYGSAHDQGSCRE